MPHIFPRRLLRTRDVLDPSDFNDDIHPVYDLVNGRLDRMNFNAGNLKNNLRAHPDTPDADGSVSGASVAEGAYFNTHVSQIESRYGFYPLLGSSTLRHPPNFVKTDGSTFRAWLEFSGTNPYAYPSVVPNHGAWSAVKNADLTGSQQLTFTTGQSKIWVSAYAQYIWQGFYEYKKPWVNGTRKFKGNDEIKSPEFGKSWLAEHSSDNLAIREREVLNQTGPSSKWESLPSEDTPNLTDNLEEYDVPFAYPLNETEGGEDERQVPNQNGYHHISKGFKPCMLQFALRVDGKVIEETITGKRLPFEESPHGLEVTDSIRTKEDDEEDDLKEFLEDFTVLNTVFGQRSFSVNSGYGDSADARPGQKMRSSRAVAYGPEVMPVRLGAVVEVQPGEHTIELVVRRLQRKKGKFEEGDFVGVFSRRMLAFDLPIKSIRQEGNAANNSLISYVVPGFQTEDKITDDNINDSRQRLGASLNKVNETHLSDNVLTNKYLPSKVVYSKTDVITPSLVIDDQTGEYGSPGNTSSSQAIFPGFDNTSSIDNVVPFKSNGWSSSGDYFSSTRAGWLQLQDDDLNKLLITAPGTEQVLRPNEKIVLMMDVEVRGIEPMYSMGAEDVLNFSRTNPEHGLQIRRLFRDFGNYILAERYLDLFALFAIGYKKDGDWVIASDIVPSMVNSFNWVNRGPLYSASNDFSLPTRVRMARHKDIWDVEPGWSEYAGTEKNGFFSLPDTPELEYGDEYPGTTGGRGGRLFRSNLGINLPIMQVLENNGTTDMNISQFGGFACTMVPSHWTSGTGPFDRRIFEVDFDATWAPDIYFNIRKMWASPVGGRDILKGVRVHFGNSKLTAIKVVK